MFVQLLYLLRLEGESEQQEESAPFSHVVYILRQEGLKEKPGVPQWVLTE